MSDILKQIDGLRRPHTLVCAAKMGAESYQRRVHLKRHFGGVTPPPSDSLLQSLLDMEQSLNTRRLNEEAGYSASRHVDLMIALISEAQIHRASLNSTVSPR